MAFALSPALFCLLQGEWRKARFFAGAALYLGVLKWLGWLLFTKPSRRLLRFPLFCAEIFVGLAIACTWFYVRSALGTLWPASYGLAEMSWAAPFLVVLHLVVAAALGRGKRRPLAEAFRAALPTVVRRAAVYAPVFFILGVALWHVSGSWNVQGGDAVRHAFQARVAIHDGLLFSHFKGGHPIYYSSGFAAMNAVAATVAPLTVVQAVNLQHVVLVVFGLFLVPCSISLLAHRPLPSIQSLPLAFLAFFPLYGLYPYWNYEGIGRQAAPALLTAICFLPALAAPRCRAGFYSFLGAEVALAVLTIAVNPACAPFVGLAGIVALVLLWRMGKRQFGIGLVRVAVGLSLFGMLALGLVFSTDAYYRRLLLTGAPSGPSPPLPANTRPFSVSQGARAAATVRPFGLTSPIGTDEGSSPDGPARLLIKVPDSLFCKLSVGLSLLACGCWVLGRKSHVRGLRAIAILVITSLALWLVLAYPITFLKGGIQPVSWALDLLSAYVGFLQFRCELIVLFTATLGSAVLLGQLARHAASRSHLGGAMAAGTQLVPAINYRIPHIWGQSTLVFKSYLALLAMVFLTAGMSVYLYMRRSRHLTSRNALGAAAALLLYITPFGLVILDPCPGGRLSLLEHPNGSPSVLQQDVELVEWIEEHIPADQGLVGLTPYAYLGQGGDPGRYLHPMDASQALILYTRRYNFCFCQDDPWFADAFDAYTRHVQNVFDADWCLRNGVRFFYVAPGALPFNPGLAAAIGDGRLRPIRVLSSCGLYEIPAPGPAQFRGP
jgi:hypothetical protein